MFAKFEALYYLPGDYDLKQRVKGGKTPPNAVGGGCGSFIVKKESPKLILALSCGPKRFEFDIYYAVKSISGQRLTGKYRHSLAIMMQNEIFEVNKGHIEDLELKLKQIIAAQEKSKKK